MLPHMAPHMDKVTLVRTVRHEMRNHNSAGYYSLTGYGPPTDDQRLRDSRELFPAYGSVVDRFAPDVVTARDFSRQLAQPGSFLARIENDVTAGCGKRLRDRTPDPP